ncbi:hypothetical protein [Mesonia sp.]|uniref:hypothetical protein n=1 Tax=Mesonia sp. TaxID=1960830 RepID=UPI003F9749C4
MSIFSNKTLSDKQITALNKLLPEHFQKNDWKESDLKGSNSIYNRFELNLSNLISSCGKEKKNLEKMNKKLINVFVNNIKIFNTEPFDSEQLGMVDIGLVKRFGASSTGDRFSNGAIGYAIESVIDDSWTNNNFQENAVNEVKLELLKKTINIYPDCNLFFKYQIDFREIGSSGNVFIYLRGTAAKGENPLLDKSIKEAKEAISNFQENISETEKTIQALQKLKNKIPRSLRELE